MENFANFVYICITHGKLPFFRQFQLKNGNFSPSLYKYIQNLQTLRGYILHAMFYNILPPNLAVTVVKDFVPLA